MKAIVILNKLMKAENWDDYYPSRNQCNEAIEELEDLQNENKSLVKTLEKYNEEMIELRKSNQELLNTIIEAQEAIKNILEEKK